MSEALQLSVAVSTYNRAETLRQTITHLADQDIDPAAYEVIIVDDGSPDQTPQMVAEIQPTLPFHLKYVRHSNHGIGYTENQGIRAARAPVVLLIADDILLSRQALCAHLASHREHPEPEAAILGQVVQSPESNQSVFLRTWNLFRFDDFERVSELPYYRFWACNISVKRDFLMRHGLFRENLGRGGPAAHEDTELGCRLHEHGLRIFYNGAAIGYHHHVVTREKACVRAYEQGLNFDEFRSYAPAPELPVAYHDLRWSTVYDHLRAWFGPRRRFLSPRDRNPAMAIVRHVVRQVTFNRATIRLIWDPIFDAAERNPKIAAWMTAGFYRGLIAYHFFRGCRDGNRRFGVP